MVEYKGGSTRSQKRNYDLLQIQVGWIVCRWGVLLGDWTGQ
jgi:hypothetical protein